MRKSQFTDRQIMDAVKRVEPGFGVPDICLEMGISATTFDLLPTSRTKVMVGSRSIKQ